MRTFQKLLCVLAGALLSANAISSTIPNTDDPKTFLGPTLKGGYTAPINDETAYSLAGEAGVKNYRVGGTFGWKLAENQWVKLSAEYLWQNINYAFFSGNSYQWVNQGALGANYQYEFMNTMYRPQVDLQGYFSHAPSKNLRTVTGTYVDSNSVTQIFTDPRRIAGSNADGISPGVTIQPWEGGKVGLDLNYDHVRYDTTFPPSQDATGFGGTFRISQALVNNVSIGGAAGVRQPFNDYSAYVSWSTDSSYGGTWVLGLDGAYTVGKHTLPNTYNVALSVNYLLDKKTIATAPKRLYKDMARYKDTNYQTVTDEFVDWVKDPAVYMPQVLAIVDPRVTTTPQACLAGVPTFTGRIADQVVNFDTVTVDMASHFTGSDLRYSILVSPAVTAPNTITIDTGTGTVSATQITPSSQIVTVTVTATNPCGSASGSFNVRFTDISR